ncbi:MAG TPA: TerB family tellurite resistance protein [Nitrospinota bacterium]|jgi:uncharacterized tellurite resistance protein B-like protein|nr:TerB family tellurite resistance protein [Nitrospinota bacterium]|tara:strand:- start:45171 stop:45617 length:447 start_codon:yes stop_codon:yes gene_type:complete
MFSNINSFFKNSKDSQDATDGHDIRVATCAIFLEMAKIDGKFTTDEQLLILEIIHSKFGLDKHLIDQLVKEAEAELDKSIDLWSFTNKINKNYTRQEKVDILECVWSLILSDSVIDQHEEYLARKLTSLLRLTHKEFIDAKLRAKSKT